MRLPTGDLGKPAVAADGLWRQSLRFTVNVEKRPVAAQIRSKMTFYAAKDMAKGPQNQGLK